MRPADIFDIVHERVKECRLQLHSAGSTWPDEMPHGGGPPRVGNPHAEYIADVFYAGKRSLFPWPQRLELFRRYYIRGEKYQEVCERLGLKYGTFRWLCSEIKKSVAPELERRGLYPPSEYKRKTVAEDDESTYTTEFLNVAEFRQPAGED